MTVVVWRQRRLKDLALYFIKSASLRLWRRLIVDERGLLCDAAFPQPRRCEERSDAATQG
jgi:hypothetical protein